MVQHVRYKKRTKKNIQTYLAEQAILQKYKEKIKNIEDSEKSKVAEEKNILKDSGIDKECKIKIAITFLVLAGLEILATYLTIYRDVLFY